jgi:hypothetical protein
MTGGTRDDRRRASGLPITTPGNSIPASPFRPLAPAPADPDVTRPIALPPIRDFILE